VSFSNAAARLKLTSACTESASCKNSSAILTYVLSLKSL
jgi:hypothetical protein